MVPDVIKAVWNRTRLKLKLMRQWKSRQLKLIPHPKRLHLWAIKLQHFETAQ